MEIFLENEEKLKLEIEYHESSQLSIIADFYAAARFREDIDESFAQKCILHLLSYGATIYYCDINSMYALSSNKASSFFDELLYMDVINRNTRRQEEIIVTFMYFKYSLIPHTDHFLRMLASSYEEGQNIDLDVVREAINKASKLFAFNEEAKEVYKVIFSDYPDIVYTMENAIYFPSLKQLAREKTRIRFVRQYGVSNIHQFYDLIKVINLPKFIKELLTYERSIYQIH